MDGESKKQLQGEEDCDILQLTCDERRIVRNLRQHAMFVKFGEFTVTFKVHDNELKFGDLHFADTTQRI